MNMKILKGKQKKISRRRNGEERSRQTIFFQNLPRQARLWKKAGKHPTKAEIF